MDIANQQEQPSKLSPDATERRREYHRQYRARNKERINSYYRDRYKKTKEKVAQYHRSYYARNKDKVCKRTSANARANRERTNAYRRKSYAKHRAEILQAERDRRATDPAHCIHKRMAHAIWSALAHDKAGRSWEVLAGYTKDELKSHIESLFTNGMGWDAFMRGDIHIDHKRPKALFSFNSTEDAAFKECWALANLQPLWAKDNLSKGCRLDYSPVVANTSAP